MEYKHKKLIIAAVLSGFCILMIIGLIKLGNILAFLLVFPWIVDHLVKAGCDLWLARLITVPIAFVIIIGLGLAASFSSVKRRAGLAVFTIALMAWSFAMFQISRDYIFDPISGQAKKCYAVTPGGHEAVSCAWKVHPLYGSVVQPATREMVSAEWVTKNGLPRIHRIDPEKTMCFFAQDGSPLVWYYQRANGTLDLFSQPGMHPQLNVPLKPVDCKQDPCCSGQQRQSSRYCFRCTEKQECSVD
jgi:hypothetical protein